MANIFSDILRPVTGPVLTAGVAAPAKGGGAALPDMSAYDWYDDNRGAVVALNGSAPLKGNGNYVATGSGAAGSTKGSGTMKQAGADGVATYAVATHARVQRMVYSKWQMASGGFAYMPTMAICKDASLAPMLHGESGPNSFLLRLVDTGPVFTDPMWQLRSANWANLATGTHYRTELHYDGNKMAAMVMRAEGGAILGQQVIYDERLPNFVGNLTFWEMLTNRLEFKEQWTKAVSDYVFPTIDVVATSLFTSGNLAANGIIDSPFGVTGNPANPTALTGELSLSPGSYPGGAGMATAISLTSGQKYYSSMRCRNVVNMVWAWANAGGTVVSDVGGQQVLAADRVAEPSGNHGRATRTFTITTTDAASRLVWLAATGGSSGTAIFDDFIVIRNPPTSFAGFGAV